MTSGPSAASEDPLTRRNGESRSGTPSLADDPPSSYANPFSPPASVRSFSRLDFTATTQAPTAPIPLSLQNLFADVIPNHWNTSGHSTVDSSNIPSGIATQQVITETGRMSRQSMARNPFAAPSVRSFSPAVVPPLQLNKRQRSKTTMLPIGSSLSKNWLEPTSRDTYTRVSYYLTYGVAFLGIVASAIRCYFGYRDVLMIKGNLCLVMDETFDSQDSVFGTNGNWFQEIDLSGFGNGEFEMTTSSSNNSFVQNNQLYIVPTLTSDAIGEAAIYDGYVFNATDCTYNTTHGTTYTSSTCSLGSGCASNSQNATTDFDSAAYYDACSAVSNSTAGTIINPVQSARLSTRASASIKYGKVEVRAKLPTGDWLWPAIWMLPVNDTYGPWPMSGEIDIMESRGNGPEYPRQGSNYVRGSLNWGPTTWLNAVSKTYGWWPRKRNGYNEGFHTYSLEWTPEFLRIYVDSRLHQMQSLKFGEPFFQRGDFPPVVQNGSQSIVLENPWVDGTVAAPFDQSFYLILDVAVGGTNGWFPDNKGGKPWLDGSATAMSDFAKAQDQWYSTWPTNIEDRAMIVDSVKMWQLC